MLLYSTLRVVKPKAAERVLDGLSFGAHELKRGFGSNFYRRMYLCPIYVW